MSKSNVMKADKYGFAWKKDERDGVWLMLLSKEKDIFGKNKQMNLFLSPDRARALAAELLRIVRTELVVEDHDDELEEALELF